MIFYTLDSGFVKKDLIDDIVSAIWTERYTSAGDVNLVVDDTPEMNEKLAEGTFLSLPESKEIMQIETLSTEEGLLTASGSSLLAFLKQRLVWNVAGLDPAVTDLALAMTPTNAIYWAVYNLAIDTDAMAFSMGDDFDLDWDAEVIPNLATIIGVPSSASDAELPRIVFPIGPLYDAVVDVADKNHLGLSLYLDSATESDYSLKFKVYEGEDRTSTQEVNPLVRFSSEFDSLSDVKRLNSIEGYKTVAYAYAAGYPIQRAISTESVPIGFDRRVVLVRVDSLPPDMNEVETSIFLFHKAQDALATNHHIKLIDGEIPSQSKHQYGSDYFLGDIVELEENDQTQKVRIAEYIRSQDATGEKAYPTISIVDETADLL